MAARFPQAECYGVDISSVPRLRQQPSNLRFFQGNVVTQPASHWRPSDGGAALPSGRELFDYMFSRLLVGGIADWPQFIQREYEMLKPGGWVEIQDIDWVWYDDEEQEISHQWTWVDALTEVCEKQIGLDFRCGSRAAQWLRNAGFLGIQVVRYMWTYGGSAEADPSIGAYSEYLLEAQPGMVQEMIEKLLTDISPDSKAELKRQISYDLQKELGKHMWMYVTIGRKPEA